MLAAALREPIFCPFAQRRKADETLVEEHVDVAWGRHEREPGRDPRIIGPLCVGYQEHR